ncbi:MAG: hypothetical protein ABIO70_30075 [Pseudomonadota bacterium]
MHRAILLSLCLCAGCFDKDDTGSDGEDFVRATIDGEAYSDGGGAAFFASSDPAWLLLFPAEQLQGSVLGWTEGQTGAWDLAFEEACEDDCNWLQYQVGGATWVSASGSLTIDAWTAHTPENEFDARIGTIEGTFSSSLSCWMGCDTTEGTIEITDGSFRSIVVQTADKGK